MTNHQVANLLKNVAASYIIKDEKKFRFQIIAYQRAADAINHLTTEAEDLYRQNKLDQIPGVGPTLKSRLEELFKKGRVKHFDWVMKGVPKTVFPLLEIPTFGPKKAYKLVKKFSLKNANKVVNDVKRLSKKGEIAKLEGFGEKSQEDILRAINEYEKGREKTSRMVLPYAFEQAEKILDYLKKSDFVIEAYPLGSLRRMVATVGDIDIAVSSKNPKEVIKWFISYPHKERIIEQGDTTASILIPGGRQVDLMIQPKESFGSLLQHFTGSKNHNIALREYALKKGLSLSEYGIKRKIANDKLKMENYDTEEKFYQAIGLQWIPPEIREDTGEIELAASHRLPKLLELSDIKGDLHLHSNYPIEPSHDLGHNSMEEMVKKAKELGYEYLGFSEHNPSVLKHNSNQIYSIIAKRNEKIEQIQSSNKTVRIIKMLEVDILANGRLALDDKALALLDAIIVSIHTSFNQNESLMTRRILGGLSHPKAKIFGHPSGRLLNERPGYEINYDEIFDFSLNHNKAIEINSYPTRLDLFDTRVREAVKNRVKLIINSDAHSVSQMETMKFGVAVAKRGWATKDDILNTLPYNEFINWLKEGG